MSCIKLFYFYGIVFCLLTEKVLNPKTKFQLSENISMDVDIQKEYARQRDHLERSVASFRKKLTKDSQIHRADNVRIMQVRVT